MQKSDFMFLALILFLGLKPNIMVQAKIGKVVSQNTKYIDKYYQVSTSSTQSDIYLGNERLATVDQDGNLTFPLVDQLGSPTIITDQYGQVVSSIDYQSFGQVNLSNGQSISNYKFIGQELDAENAWEYFGQRYYDAQLARFTSIDPLLIADPGKFLVNPQLLNSYSYAINNPISYFDVLGLSTATINPMPSGGWQFGNAMGQFNGVTAYYNGIGSSNTTYSCVEYAKRYWAQVYGINGIGSIIDPNNTWNIVDTMNQRLADVKSPYSILQNTNGQGFILPKEGDWLIWTDNKRGHVMVVTESSFNNNTNTGYVEIVDQNANKQAVRKFDVVNTGSGYTVMKNKNEAMAGWLSPVSKNNNSVNTNQSAGPSNLKTNQSTSLWQNLWYSTKQFFNKIF